MDKINSELNLHIFVCTNKRDEKKSCGSLQIIKLRDELKVEFCKLYGNKVRVSKAGCLGYCQQGAALVIYPDNIRLENVEYSDKNKIIDLVTELIEARK